MENKTALRHLENRNDLASVIPANIYTDEHLLKAGANGVKEDSVANVHLVRALALLGLEHY